MRRVIFAILLAVALVCSGCAANAKQFQPTNASVNVGGSFAGTWGHLESAKYDYGQAKKFMKEDAGIHFMDAGDAEIASAFAKLTEGMKSHEAEVIANGKLRDEMVVCHSELAAERAQWFGDRLHFWFGWLAIAGLALIAAHFWLGGSVLGALPFTAIFKRVFGKA